MIKWILWEWSGEERAIIHLMLLLFWWLVRHVLQRIENCWDTMRVGFNCGVRGSWMNFSRGCDDEPLLMMIKLYDSLDISLPFTQAEVVNILHQITDSLHN